MKVLRIDRHYLKGNQYREGSYSYEVVFDDGAQPHEYSREHTVLASAALAAYSREQEKEQHDYLVEIGVI